MKKIILLLLTTAAATAAIGFGACSSGRTGSGDGTTLSRMIQNATQSEESSSAPEAEKPDSGFEFIPQGMPHAPHMLPPHDIIFERMPDELKKEILEHSRGNMPELMTKEGVTSEAEDSNKTELTEQPEQPEQPVKKPRRKNRRTKEKRDQQTTENAAENLQGVFDSEVGAPSARPLPTALGKPTKDGKKRGLIRKEDKKLPENDGNTGN